MERVSSLPNQMLIALLMKQLLELSVGLKVSLVASEKKMMSLLRYELMKTEQF